MREHQSKRHHMQMAFSRRTKIPLRFTKVMTSGDWFSHCGIVVNNGRHIVEALQRRGVVVTPRDEWEARYPYFAFADYMVPDAEAGEAFALGQEGKLYDYWGAYTAPWRTDWQDDTRWYCSELAAAALIAADRPCFRETQLGVRPMDVYQLPRFYPVAANDSYYRWLQQQKKQA